MNETCTDCPAPAVCEYDWGTGLRRACVGHDPLRSPYGLTVRAPMYYRTTGFPVVAAGGWVPAYEAYAGLYGANRSIPWDSYTVGWDSHTVAPGCICTRFGPGTVPCPVHQPAPSTVVTC